MQLRNAAHQERDAEATLADILKAVDGLAGTLVVVAARLRSSKPKLTTPRPARLAASGLCRPDTAAAQHAQPTQ